MDWNIEQQEAHYDYYERLKKEYEAILKELWEKYPTAQLENFQSSLDELKNQVVTIDEFIEKAERKAEELLSQDQELKSELLKRFEDIKELIDRELWPELEKIKFELVWNKLEWSSQTKEFAAEQWRRVADKEVVSTLLEIEQKITSILSPLWDIGKVLIRIFRYLLYKAWIDKQ